MQTQARELSQKIGVDARLYALEASQRAGKMDDMVQLFATYNGNPGTGQVCIVTGAATDAKTSTDDAGASWVKWGNRLKKCKDHTANETITAKELDAAAEALSTKKKLFTTSGGLITGGADGCMLLSSAANNAAVVFKGSISTPGTATLGGIWYIKGVATDVNGIELGAGRQAQRERSRPIRRPWCREKGTTAHTAAKIHRTQHAQHSHRQLRRAVPRTDTNRRKRSRHTKTARTGATAGVPRTAKSSAHERQRKEDTGRMARRRHEQCHNKHTRTHTTRHRSTTRHRHSDKHRDKGHARGTLKQHTTATKGHTS
ncbi:hypothetical protein, conserved in T. vivax [Trypanosoma vivax Y486]|uniref:Trypanosome variant surface glycoprotein A-type N-terminal domain-containing protein n=1 Tax=Trypanosoma vivax (strain Y486) TaxID=1055687 RepID=F9WTM1_TRYVY|nr:hypothetical protein, conserved in T. vivax [Trypanosoma vivax Y486]|eukprot:CCD20915.1 hypothetical protein, conserved in T. vivax [Trypanosoma vivax Y486]